jgi:enamine deaminase RidA (YjgF/YER057c/UK114 family)
MAERIVPASMQSYYDDFHFAPAVVDGDQIHVSGVIGTDLSKGGAVSDDPASQFAQAFENLAEVLAAAGAGLADIVEMTTFHVGLQKHFRAFTTVKDRYIKEPYPAWTAIGISELAVPGGLVEIRATARRP